MTENVISLLGESALSLLGSTTTPTCTDGESAPSFDVAVGEPEVLIMSSEVPDASPSLVLDGCSFKL